MKTYKVKLNDRYNSIILEAIKDKQHLVNNLNILWNKSNNKEIKSDLLNPIRFKKILMEKSDNSNYINEFIDQYNVILRFKEKYTYDVLNSILREYSKNLKVNLKLSKSFKMKNKKLNNVSTGSLLIENNNISYYNDYKKGRKRLYQKEFGIALYSKKYIKEKGYKNNLKIYFNDKDLKDKCKEIRTISLVYKHTHSFIDISYIEKDNYYNDMSKNKYILSIDPGSKNHLTLYSDNPKTPSIIIRNNAINKLLRTESNVIDNLKKDYNKNKWYIKNFYYKRYIIVNQELNKISSRILDYCKKLNISKIIFGNGYSSKNSSNMISKNNRKFYNFPHYTLKLMLKNKLKFYNIQLIDQEESYTSKLPAILNINIWDYNIDNKPSEDIRNLGHRSSQSVFNTIYKGKNISYNADINGSINILKKYLKKDNVNINNYKLCNPILINSDFDFLNFLYLE